MKFHNIAIGVLIISVIVLGCITYMSDLSDSYGATADLASINRTAQHLNKTQALAQDLNTQISEVKLTSIGEAFEIPYELIRVAWTMTRLVFNSWTTTEAIIKDSATVADESGITLPSWFVPTIVSTIIIIIGAIIVYALFKWKFED